MPQNRGVPINPFISYGVWDGFGASLSWWANALGCDPKSQRILPGDRLNFVFSRPQPRQREDLADLFFTMNDTVFLKDLNVQAPRAPGQ